MTDEQFQALIDAINTLTSAVSEAINNISTCSEYGIERRLDKLIDVIEFK